MLNNRKIIALGLASFLAVSLPFFITNFYLRHIIIICFVYASLAMSWDLLGGYVGLVSLAHVAFFGIGAYTSAILAWRFSVSPWIGLFVGSIVAGVAGLAICLPTLRLRGIYFALATLAFSEIFRILVTVKEFKYWTNGSEGIFVGNFPGITTELDSYYLALFLFVMSAIILIKLKKSSFGVILQAIREDTDRVEGIGFNVARYKFLAFFASCFFAGMMGSFSVHYLNVISPRDILPHISFLVMGMAIIGGKGTLLGPLMGGLVAAFLNEYPRSLGYIGHQLAIGIAMFLIILVFPAGLNGLLKLIKEWLIGGRTQELIEKGQN
jgi:branched-chain amino acid transport system permease protein